MHHKYKSHTENGVRQVDDTEELEKPSNRETNGNAAKAEPPLVEQHKPRRWIWFTSSTTYWHELGFLAGVIQLCAATIFWIAG